MSSRPRRSAAAKAKEVISVHARWADTSEKEDAGISMSSRRTGRAGGASASRDTASSPEETHLSVTVKLPNSRSRQATRGGNRRADPFEGGEIVHGKRNRGGKKSYVIDSSPDDEEEEEEEEEVVVEDDEDDDEEDDDDDEEDARADDDDDMEELGDEDAEGEDEMEVDAEGEEDADGDIDMAPKPVGRPSAKNSRITKSRPTVKVTSSRINRDEDEDEDEEEDDDDDDELSDPADSDIGDDTIVYGDQAMEDEDAEGEEIEVAGDEEDVEEDDEIAMQQEANGDSDLDSEEGSRAETPDLAKMTKRQRARFEDIPQEFMKLPDEIQVKKVFTAEELSMRRQEMARRRRNLSEKRNEEVKMETINKLLKKQAPKINRKAAAAEQEQDSQKANPIFIRWVSNKSGNRVAVPEEIIEGPAGALFGDKTQPSLGKPVVEVA
ncbi:PAPA-1-like conserved region domain-containing protein [Trichoderma sp. SZMC 28013]